MTVTDLPWEALRGIALRKLCEIESVPLFVTISGAHLYGFASPDSDFDIRGCHLRPLSQVVSLAPPRETLEYSAVEDGREIDLVSHDAAKFFRLMLRKNGYVLEQIFSPLIVIGGPDFEELRDVARGCITKHLYHHYRGFFETQQALLEKESTKKAKTILYAYRVLLTGIHVLRSGEVEANLSRLLELYPQDGLNDLMAAKVRELAPIEWKEAHRHLTKIQSLRRELDTAFESSPLDDTPRCAQDLDRLLIRLRMAGR